MPHDKHFRNLLDLLRDYKLKLAHYEHEVMRIKKQIVGVESLLDNWETDGLSDPGEYSEEREREENYSYTAEKEEAPKLLSESSFLEEDDESEVYLEPEIDAEAKSELGTEEFNSDAILSRQEREETREERSRRISKGARKNAKYAGINMLPEYDNLTRVEAVTKALEKYSGEALHVNYLTKEMYGDLDDGAMETAVTRLRDTLTRGCKEGKFDKVPRDPGYYTFDVKLLDK